jgi:hypothetical protein
MPSQSVQYISRSTSLTGAERTCALQDAANAPHAPFARLEMLTAERP